MISEYNVQKKTILKHLRKFLFEGFSLRLSGLENLSNLAEETQRRVLISFSMLGADTLRPVYDDLEGEVDWDDLRIMQLYYISKSIADHENKESPVENENRKNIREIIQNIGFIEDVNKQYSTDSTFDRFVRSVARQILRDDKTEEENTLQHETEYQRRRHELKQKYPNAYEPWKDEDDELLTREFRAGKSIEELCSIFKRHPGAITSRLRKLSLR